jgi:hypothetical protein
MIHFNIDHLLPFQGYSVNGVRQSFISLSHFLACEKHYTFNSDYYLHLCTLQSLDDIFTETSQYSNDLINSHFAKHRNRIILTGLHFSINQNKDYFFGFDTFEEDVYSEDPDLNDLINNYRKRYMIATNTDRLFLYSDDDWSEKQESLTEYIVNLLTDSPPEEVIIEDGTRFTLHAMGGCKTNCVTAQFTHEELTAPQILS